MEQTYIEDQVLQEVVKTCQVVRLIFISGFQCDAIIEGYDYQCIRCLVKDKTWLVYRSGLSTIALY